MPSPRNNNSDSRATSQESASYQIGQIGSFKVSFRTMPHDLELLAGKQKPVKIKELKKEVEMPSIATQETALPPTSPSPTPALQIDIDKELSEKKRVETEKITEGKIPASLPPIPKPPAVAALYREAKSLYNRKFYNEALEKFNEILLLRPGHLRARWFSGRTKKKLQKKQKPVVIQKPEPLKAAAEQIKVKEKKEKIEQPKGKIEEAIKIEPKPKEKNIEEPRIIEPEKTPAIEPRKTQEEMEKIKQETAAQIEEKFTRQLQEEEERLKTEQLARQKLEQELSRAQEEKRKIEEQIKQERETLAQAEQSKIEEKKMPPPAPPIVLPAQLPPAAPIPSSTPIASKITPKTKESLLKNLQLLLSLKIAKAVGVIIIAGLIFSGLAYFTGLYKIISSKPTEQPALPTYTEEILPPSLFAVDQTETIVLQAGQKKNLFQALNKLIENNYLSGTHVRVLIKFTNENQEQKYASLVDLADALQIVIPTDVLTNLENKYTLFLYSQKEAPSSPFLIGLGKNKLGIVISFREQDKIVQQFLDWQKSMPSDLDALFLGKKISFSAEYQFQEKTHGGVIIHSVDLPNEYSSLNYAFVNNNVMIATSLESMESLIDKITKTQ